ncbi:hypothetical protein KDL44_13860 [bacterium]|nr:hypothetical protein [bacterium]
MELPASAVVEPVAIRTSQLSCKADREVIRQDDNELAEKFTTEHAVSTKLFPVIIWALAIFTASH